MLTVILTCYNRKEKTCKCIQSLIQGNPEVRFTFIVVDDESSDGTGEAVKNLAKDDCPVYVIKGNGGLYWAGGMRKGIEYAKAKINSEYYMLINDDVYFCDHAIERMLEEIQKGQVLVGPMCDDKGNAVYGGIRYKGYGMKYSIIGPGEKERGCDTFNANCVLMPKNIFLQAPNIDSAYIHSLGDFDYGLCLKKMGFKICVFHSFVGICPDNPIEGTWQDISLSRRERIKRKEEPKGAPCKPWFHYLKKNFGVRIAIIYSLTPYIRIILGR